MQVYIRFRLDMGRVSKKNLLTPPINFTLTDQLHN